MDEFENKIIQPPNLEGTSFLQVFKSDPSNIKVCQEYLADKNCSKQLQIILSSAIYDFVRNTNDINFLLQLEHDFNLSDWCIRILETNYTFFEKSTIKTISIIFSYIIFHLWSNNMNTKFNSISKLQFSPFCQFNLMNETIFIFSQNYKIFSQNSEDPRNKFKKQLRVLFEIAFDFLNPNNDQDTIDVALQVIFQCICYGEITYFTSSTKENTSNSLKQPREVDLLLSTDLVVLLFDVYIKTRQYFALKSLFCILKLNNSTFGSDLRNRVIESYTENLQQFLTIFLRVDNPDLLLLTELLLSYSEKLQSSLLTNNDKILTSFIASMTILSQFCSLIYESDTILKDELIIYSNLMIFWAKLSIIFEKNQDVCKSVFDLINNVSIKYTIFLLKLILMNDLEICEQIVNNDTLILPYQILIASSAVDTFSIVISVFREYLSSNKSHLTLVLFLKIASIALEESPVIYSQKDLLPRKLSVFDLSMKIIESTTLVLQANQEAFSVILECIVLRFIQNFNKYSIKDIDPCLFFKTTVFFLKRTILSLQIFDHNDQLIEEAVLALRTILSIDFEENEFYKEYKKQCFELLHNFGGFPFFREKTILNPTQKYNKMSFISSIFFLSYKFQCLAVINNFLNSLISENDIFGLVTSLNGILSCPQKLAKKAALHIADWLILGNNLSFFIDHAANLTDNLFILKFMKKILRAEKITEMGHSDYGIVIFEACSDILGKSITFYSDLIDKKENEDNDQIYYQFSKEISRCSSLLLGRKYISFKAFMIYNSPTVINFLNAVALFTEKTNFQNVLDYMKLFSSFCSLFDVMATNHLDLCNNLVFIQISNFYSNLMLQHQIDIIKVKSDDVNFNIFNGLKNFIQYVNLSTRNDINEIRETVHNCFLISFCFLTENVINRRIYDNCDIIQLLVAHDASFLDLFKNKFILILQNQDEFLQLFDTFINKLPILMSPKSLKNDFNLFWEKFSGYDKIQQLNYKEIH